MSADILIVFVKNPELGCVKTRLAKTIGEEAALAIYLKLLAQCHNLTEQLTHDVAIYYSQYVDSEDFWENKKYKKYVQRGANLGEKMYNAIADGFGKGYQKVCLIGSDIHSLTADIIKCGFDILDSKDVVIGPAEDGGYYMIGAKQSNKEIFKISEWSTDRVFEQTISLIKSQGLSCGQTALLNDIDDYDDLRKAGLF